MKFPSAIQNLINHFSRLPTVGPKTAERYVFYLLKQNPEMLNAFAVALNDLKKKTVTCDSCHALAETNPCQVCADPKRQKDLLCIVADSRNYLSIESTNQFPGLYFILGGELDHLEGITPEQLNIRTLEARAKAGEFMEAILALNPTMEGETTTLYLTKLLKTYNIRVTRLARGLPMGADLEYVDELTLSNSLKYRNEL